MSNAHNPIRSVDGQSVLPPNTYQWDVEDISKSGAGRTENGLMHKRKLRQAVKLSLTWESLTTAEVSALLNTFAPEYFTVVYLDPFQNSWVQAEFYVGNRSAPLHNAETGRWSLSFNIIER